MVAFYIAGRDAGFNLFNGVASDYFCGTCGGLRDLNYLPKAIGGKVNVRFDMFSSSEGVEFVSDKFRRFLEGVPGAEIIEIQSTGGTLNALRSSQLIAFDTSRRPVIFENQCGECGQFRDVYRALPIYLMPGQFIEPGNLYMTDLYSGHGRLKRRKLVAATELAEEIRRQGFTGVSFDPVIA